MCEWVETDEPAGEFLFPGGIRDAAPDKIRNQVLPRLTRMVSAMCSWGRIGEDCFPGDVRFMIIEFNVSADTAFYVQILNEPEDVVLAEAVSPAWHPELRDRIGQPERRALGAMGYRVGGRARNFQKERKVETPEDAQALAGELLGILIDVFRYRGRQPLLVHRVSDTRCATETVFTGMCESDVRKVLREAGCEVASLEPGKSPAPVRRGLRERLLIVVGPFPFSVFLESPVKRGSASYQWAALESELDGTKRVSDSTAVAASRFVRLGRLARSPSGNLSVLLDLPLVGITMGSLVASLRSWLDVRRAAQDWLAPAGKPSRKGRNRAHDSSSSERRTRLQDRVLAPIPPFTAGDRVSRDAAHDRAVRRG